MKTFRRRNKKCCLYENTVLKKSFLRSILLGIKGGFGGGKNKEGTPTQREYDMRAPAVSK